VDLLAEPFSPCSNSAEGENCGLWCWTVIVGLCVICTVGSLSSLESYQKYSKRNPVLY